MSDDKTNELELWLEKLDMPEDAYGVLVLNEVDARRLKYLVEQIGEAKLRRHTKMYAEKWEGAKPFVSKVLKTFQVKVPTSAY